jgi:hypothetical protein
MSFIEENNINKYPRTAHLPWSMGFSEDDIISSDLSLFENEIVITEKLDGENSNLYNNYFHARSITTPHHESQDWLKTLHASIKNDIPPLWRISGENLFAKHSIGYENLESYFYAFSMWDDKNFCLSWDETEEWAALLGLETVPVLYRGKWNDAPEKIHDLIWNKKVDEESHEGYVVRNAGKFHYSKFRENVLKYVRKNHVRTSTHWKFERIEQNKLI